MATGIVAVALWMLPLKLASWVLFGITALLWLGLVVVHTRRWVGENPAREARTARRPISLTLVASTAVLGTMMVLVGGSPLAWVLLGLSTGLWVVLLPTVLRSWSNPIGGDGFLVCVSTESIAVLSATLSLRVHATWLFVPAALMFVLGVGLYLFAVASFSWAELLRGAGDQWILGGAVSIATVAATRISLVLARTADPPMAPPLRTLSLVLWSAAIGLCAVLAVTELLRPRLRYDPKRWSTVFPLGMTAVASLAVGQIEASGVIQTIGEVFVWLSVAAWLAITTCASAKPLSVLKLSLAPQRWRSLF